MGSFGNKTIDVLTSIVTKPVATPPGNVTVGMGLGVGDGIKLGGKTLYVFAALISVLMGKVLMLCT